MPSKMTPLVKVKIQEAYPQGIIGVYAIGFREWPNLVYFGSSKNVRARLLSHANNLSKGKHKNHKLSKLYPQYKNSCFCTLVKECSTEEEARKYEQLCIDFDTRAKLNVDKSVVRYKRRKR
jgi:predicted GIY-YIG superfamily endonuclease